MRDVNMPYDKIRFEAYYEVNGVGQSGLSPTLRILRHNGNQWLNDVGPAWQATPVDIAMVEEESTEFPGLYSYTVPGATISRVTGALGYTARIDKNVDDDQEVVQAHVRDPANEVLAESLRPTTAWAGGTIGEALLRMLSLRQENQNTVYTGWNAAGEPNAGTVWIYETQGDAAADTGGVGGLPVGLASIGAYAFAVTFDGTLRITSYRSTKTA